MTTKTETEPLACCTCIAPKCERQAAGVAKAVEAGAT